MAKKNELKYKSWEDLDKGLKKLAELEYQKSILENDKALKINTYETVYNEEFEPLAKQMNEINEDVTLFVAAHKDEFEKAKTKKLPNGTIQCRTSSRVDIPDEEKTMEFIKKFKLDHCRKTTESLNKDVIKTLDEKTLKQIKVSIVKENKFIVKTNQYELKAVATA